MTPILQMTQPFLLEPCDSDEGDMSGTDGLDNLTSFPSLFSPLLPLPYTHFPDYFYSKQWQCDVETQKES